MKKLLFIIPNFNSGGAEKVTINIINLLAEKYSVNLAVFESKGLYSGLVNSKVNIITLETKRLRSSIHKIIFLIFKKKPDVVFSSLLHINIFLLIIKCTIFYKLKLVLRESNMPVENVKRNRFLKYIYIYLYKYTNYLIASSNTMRLQFIKNFKINETKVIFIPNPIIFKNNLNDELSYNFFRHDKINLLSVGRFTKQKNYQFMIDAFAKSLNDQLILNIFGEGNDKSLIFNKIYNNKLSEKIFLRGVTKNICNIYDKSDILIMCSKWEGMSNVILEALFRGLKVIVSKQSGGAQDLKEFFNDKLYFYNDKKDLIKFLNNLNLQAVKKENKKIYIPKEYSLENIFNLYSQII